MHYVFGDCELDAHLYQLHRAGELVELEPKVFDLLVYLIQHHDRVVSKDELLGKLWPGQVVSEAALTQCVMAARKAVGDDGTRQHTIKTQHGRGYRFVAPLTTTAPPVSSSTFQVPSQEEVASSQEAEASQKVEGENGSGSSVHSIEAEEPRRLQNGQTLDPRLGDSIRQTLDVSMATHSWLSPKLVVVAVLLLVGTALTVHYLSRPTLSTQDSALRIDAASAALPLPDKPSIIVLPFVNLSGDPGQEYFSDGVTEEITSTLSRLSSLFVIARTSAFTYKGKAVKVQDISREMGVRYVLEGSVQKADGQVRIIVQLIDATTGKHLWSERYDRPLQNIFALQDEIREKIVLALKIKLVPEEQERFQRMPTNNLEAYDYLLRGHELSLRTLQGTKKELNEQARLMYEKAIELDPQYAGAYAWLGWTYFQDAFYLWSKDRSQTLEQASKLARQAVALEESLSTAHWILGMVFLWQKQHNQAISEGERAIALNANDADSYVSLGNTLVFAGRPEEGLELIRKAMRLNPHYPPRYLNLLGLAYRMAGWCEEALLPLEKAVALEPNFSPSYFNLAACYVELDRLAEAQKGVAEILRINPNASLENVGKFIPYKDPTDMERTLAALRKAGLK